MEKLNLTKENIPQLVEEILNSDLYERFYVELHRQLYTDNNCSKISNRMQRWGIMVEEMGGRNGTPVSESWRLNYAENLIKTQKW